MDSYNSLRDSSALPSFTIRIEMDRNLTKEEMDILTERVDKWEKEIPTVEDLATMLKDQADEVSMLTVDEMENFLIPGQPGYGTRRFEEVSIILGLKMEIDILKRYVFELREFKKDK